MGDGVRVRLPKNFLFDLDGTLLDSLPGIAFSVQEACRAAGLPEPEIDLRRLLGPPIRTILSRALCTEDVGLLDKLEKAFRISYDAEGWRKTSWFQGAPEALQAMRMAGHRLFVVTNKPRHIALRILEHDGMAALFEEIYTRDSYSPSCVSKEEIVQRVLTDCGGSPRDYLMVGDTMEDGQAAATAGIGFVYMTHGYGDISEMAALPCALKLDSFRQFLPLVTQEPVCDR